MHHVFVDFENLRPELPADLALRGLSFFVFFGGTRKSSTLDGEELAYLRRLGPEATAITLAAPGPNALDFHVAFYVGRVTAGDPAASISIISNDKGFDPLVHHLRQTGVPAIRSPSLEALPVVLLVQTLNARQRAEWVLPHIAANVTSTEKKLTRLLHRRFCRCLSDSDVEAVRLEVEALLRLRGPLGEAA